MNSIASLRAYSFAKYWSQAGCDVTVLTTKKETHSKFDLSLDHLSCEIIEVPLPKYISSLRNEYRTGVSGSCSENNSMLKDFLLNIRKKCGIFHSCRMPDLSDFWIRPALNAVKDMKPWDVIVSTSGPYSVNIVANRLKKRGQGKYWIADFRDRWSDNHVMPGLFPFNIIEKGLERFLMRKADAISTISDPYADSFRKKYGHNKVYVVENGFDPEDFDNVSKAPIFSDDGKVRFVHTGSMYWKIQNPDPLFAAISQMSMSPEKKKLLENLEIIFVGPDMSLPGEMIAKYGVAQWVKTKGFMNRESALRMQRDAHYLLFFPFYDSSVDGVLPGKIFEYLFSNTPILAIGGKKDEAAQKLIRKAKGGVILRNQEMCEEFLITSLKERKKERCVADAHILQNYLRVTLAEKMLSIAKKLERFKEFQ